MTAKDGDVIDFDYELWVEGEERLHDTTLKDAAQEAGLFDAEAFYAPMTYILGSGRLIPGLEKALRTTPAGETRLVELAAGEAYGPRDPKLIETLPLHEFKKNDVDPQPGLAVSFKNRRGVVTTVGGGRVRVDFNPALAGKSLKYRYTVRRIITDDAERVAGVLRMHFPSPLSWKTRIETEKGRRVAVVDVPEQVVLHQNWLAAKFRALMDLRRFTDLAEVRFVEPYRLRPEGEASEAKAGVASTA